MWILSAVRLLGTTLILEVTVSCRKPVSYRWGLCPLPISELDLLAQTCAGPVHAAKVCESICGSALLCLEGLISLLSSFASGSYNLCASFPAGFSDLQGGEFDGDIPFRIECSRPHSAHCHNVGLLFIFIHLQEASLMWVKWGIGYIGIGVGNFFCYVP